MTAEEIVAAEALVTAILPAKGGTESERAQKDAANADRAFTGILATAVAALEAPAIVGSIAAEIGTLGIGTPGVVAIHSAIAGAAVAVAKLWHDLPAGEKAKIWRGVAIGGAAANLAGSTMGGPK